MARPSALPISVRLALWYALALFVLLSAFAVFCYVGYHAAVHRSFDRHLQHELDAVAPLVTSTNGSLDGTALDGSAAVATRLHGGNGTYVRLLAPSGDVLYSSPNMRLRPDLPVLLPEASGTRSESRTWANDPARTLVSPVIANSRIAGYIEVTGIEWARHQELNELAWLLAAGVVLGIVFSVGVGWWMARRSLRPVALMTDAATRMAGSNASLGERLPSDFRTRDELTRLAETFNGLLDRLEASVERERRFTANAAHELLTPLATIRTDSDVALRRERDASAYREVLGRVVEDAESMSATVQGLLQLARAEEPKRAHLGPIDLSEFVRTRTQRHAAAAELKDIALTVHAQDGISIKAGATPVADVLDNLLSNAIKYTPSGGRVDVRLTHGDGAVGCAGATRLSVSDTGIGFDAADGAKLFDRFHRADTPEVQAEPGSGLGLAIVKAVVEGYGGSVGSESDGPGRGALFWVELPCLGVDQASRSVVGASG